MMVDYYCEEHLFWSREDGGSPIQIELDDGKVLMTLTRTCPAHRAGRRGTAQAACKSDISVVAALAPPCAAGPDQGPLYPFHT